MNKQVLESLRDRFDNGRVITMGELDMLIRYAQEMESRFSEIDTWFSSAPNTGASR